MYSIRPYQAYSFRCWFSNNSILAFVVNMLPQDLVSLCSLHSILTFVPEALWCSSFQPIISNVSGPCSCRAYPFNRSVVPSFQVLSPYQVLIQFLSFQPECCPNFGFPWSPSLTGVFSIYILPFNLKVFRNALCPSFLTECFRPSSPSLYSFLEMV